MEKYDELLEQSQQIGAKLSNLYQEKHAVQVFIKDEAKEDFTEYGQDSQSVLDTGVDDQQNESSDESYDDPFNCQHCGAGFKSERKFWAHLKNHFPTKSETDSFCQTCSKTFKTTGALEFHLLTDHDRMTGPFECTICFKNFEKRDAFKNHHSKHTKEKTLLCTRYLY